MRTTVHDIKGNGCIVDQLRALADRLEQQDDVGSAVLVITPEIDIDNVAIFVMGPSAMGAILSASATLEAIIDSLPANSVTL